MTATATPSARKLSVVLDRDREAPVGATGTILQIPLELIDVDENVRKSIDQARIAELAESIEEHGVLQPISVRDTAGDRYAINFGQSRFLASKLLGLATIPAFLDNVQRSPGELAIHQLLENMHRADVNAMDLARGMRIALDELGITHAALATHLGIGETTVTNAVGLLKSPAKVQEAVAAGQITAAHAKAIKGLTTSEQEELLQEALDEHLTAHELEEEVQDRKERAQRDAEYAAQNEEAARAAVERYEAKLEAIVKKVPLDTEIRVSGYTWSDGEAKLKAIEDGLKAKGFTNVRRERAEARQKGFCDCTAWKVELGYNGGVSASPACVNRNHTAAKYSADAKASEAYRNLQGRVRQALARELVDQVASLGPLAARITLWRLLGWRMDEWAKNVDANRPLIESMDPAAEQRKARTTRDPWATIGELDLDRLRAEIVKNLASDLNDGNFKVDWEALADELGLNDPKPVRAAAAPAAPAFGQLVINGDAKYRILAVGDRLQLVADERQWRNGKPVGYATAAGLTWDAEEKGWTGPVVLSGLPS